MLSRMPPPIPMARLPKKTIPRDPAQYHSMAPAIVNRQAARNTAFFPILSAKIPPAIVATMNPANWTVVAPDISSGEIPKSPAARKRMDGMMFAETANTVSENNAANAGAAFQ